ncbi:HNH endonuclease [Stenotrophomonas rhizophila]|uniref:HNH endonuclease n=1 Tax=Stenotrophomonas rhizophila TaxID=216778 RepID=UPI003D18F1D8
MTGCGVVDVLEAAHVPPYMGKETNVVSNGLLLRADVHTLFDPFLIGVDPITMQICIAPSLAASIYGELKGRPLATPSTKRHLVDKSLIEKHRALCEW